MTTFNGLLHPIDPLTGAADVPGQITGSNGAVARIASDQAGSTLYGIANRNRPVTVDLGSLAASEVAQFRSARCGFRKPAARARARHCGPAHPRARRPACSPTANSL